MQEDTSRNLSLNVTTQKGITPEVTKLLEQTIFGTKGKVRYRQKHIVDGMKSLKNLEFIQIKKGDRLFGTTGVVSRNTTGLAPSLNSLYIRYLSINNPFRNQGKPNQNASRKASRVGTTLKQKIGAEITNHFESPFLEKDQKGVFYAFVESENYNSKELCITMGFYPQRRVSTILFSRFSPKKSELCNEIKESGMASLKEKLSEHYSDHSFYFDDQLSDSGSYFVLEKEGKILAGVRCKPVHWELIEVPGFSGFLMQKVLPYLPVTNRLFKPKQFSFLAFDYAWTSSDNIDYLLEVMEHCCAAHNINTGMIWCDTEAKIAQLFQNSGNLGFLNTIRKDVTAEVMMRFIGFEEREKVELLNKPVFVSASDMT
ncbi:MAG: hypothetical protein ED557_12525 [Balneola sp.]|nr:MAG: hypothetical protein ED557_12525 [Balneola sp.]